MPHQDLRTKAGVILAQSDTTIGFFSHDQDRLNATKNSPKNKRLLQVCAGFKDLPRVPPKQRALVRRAKATFIYKNKEDWRAFRVVQEPSVLVFLKRLDAVFSTSANLSGQGYEPQIALDLANTIIEDKRGLSPRKPSSIIKLGHARKRRLR
ncbi:TsaC protein (YrdC domain) required for threonylcarbamoyladenosine t(6)A37 modification in tRNA [Helicobacter heilmannii]|uniref:N6-threonylcarbamoyl adenosine t(6)A37 modification in tRNA n=1 Tax=Helicobacter heilmannii TaxID=35817 RepID=UPI0006A1C01D|nr:N6-threonylcarbamoyl adenosine t(6)A37 modification in tRNA [Helicobacter heilmannii]CRF48664.1 TsaC protein (YrdC domain) required for threonylcarbamoyladenosine t(6)A37 modification in tRNA [Helicobacter heilmannii]